LHEYGVTQEDLAEFAVLMRAHALTHPGAQFHDPITVADVMASKPVAMPLKLLDCCPVSDGGAAFVISRELTSGIGVRVRGCAQAHTHQHVTAAPALSELGAEIAIAKAKQAAGVAISDVRYAAVYDSFTITLAMLLEDLGLAKRGEAAARVRSGHFSRDGAMPLNTHGGLLSYGHCGVGGAMAHLVETHLQMTERAGNRQVRDASMALLHGDGGVLSSHVTMFLSGCDERQTRRLDHWRRSNRLSGLRGLREPAILLPQLLLRLRRAGPGRESRERRGDGLRNLAGVPRRHAGDPRACALQHRAGRYRGGLSHDGPRRQ
jgi:acetyl-CoA acetyltransferase